MLCECEAWPSTTGKGRAVHLLCHALERRVSGVHANMCACVFFMCRTLWTSTSSAQVRNLLSSHSWAAPLCSRSSAGEIHQARQPPSQPPACAAGHGRACMRQCMLQTLRGFDYEHFCRHSHEPQTNSSMVTDGCQSCCIFTCVICIACKRTYPKMQAALAAVSICFCRVDLASLTYRPPAFHAR